MMYSPMLPGFGREFSTIIEFAAANEGTERQIIGRHVKPQHRL